MSHPCPKWYRIMFHNAKTHLVQGALRADLLADLAARSSTPNTALEGHAGPDYAAIKRVRAYGLDSGGMCYADEPFVGLQLDNLPLEFPCSFVLSLRLQAEALPLRYFASSRPYVKLHGSFHCLVLSPRQHRQLVAKLTALTPKAEETAAVFFASKRAPGEILRDIAAKQRGLDPADLGPPENFARTTADRFIPRTRGEA